MPRSKIMLILGLVIVLAAAGAGWFWWSANQSTINTATLGPATASGPGFTVVSSDRTMGNPKAKVTLIEYAAPICPHCANFWMTDFPTLKTNYIDTGKVFYVFRVFPLNPADGQAEKIARCLPEDKYFPFIDLLFRNQSLWDPEFNVLDVHGGLVRVARIAGVSAEQVDKCIDNKTEDDRINKVAADGEAKYNITGTPTFVIDGVAQPSGGIPYAELSKLLDAELAKNK